MLNAPQMLELQAYANAKNQRLGQLINNAIGHELDKPSKTSLVTDREVGTRLFYIDDTELLECVRTYVKETS